ncbi:MAG: PTS sugar transporter subunit IIA, partial [Burkholderiaceae bacterium]
HGRIKGLEDAVAAVFRLATPIPFDAPDGQPVSVLIFLLVPEQATQQHLELLSEVAEMLSDTGLREALLGSQDPQALHQALCAWRSAGG